MQLIAEIRSQIDNTVKQIFQSSENYLEFSFLDKSDDKHHVCVPSQTACRMGCTFCAMSDFDTRVRNLTQDEIVDGVRSTLLAGRRIRAETLLVSFMGAGEPTRNSNALIPAAKVLRSYYESEYKVVRFAIASMIPLLSRLEAFAYRVALHRLDCKLHWSLHSARQHVRDRLMPVASSLRDSLQLVLQYRDLTGCAVEAHYTPMSGVNDTPEDVTALSELLVGTGIPIKLIRFNERPTSELRVTDRASEFQTELESVGLTVEAYCPPGSDIQSSCGQFTAKYYQRH